MVEHCKQNQQSTMKQGVLLFAVDTNTVSYTSIASYCAKKIKQHLNLSVTLVTDSTILNPIFDNVITIDKVDSQERSISGGIETWRNFNRYHAYELSPYDQTLLLDCDYICNSTQLLKLFDFNQNLLCHKRRMYLGSLDPTHEIELFGNNIEMYWATVVYFTKSDESKCVFEMIKMIQHNYDHYAKLYRFNPNPYRNDYALSIALNAVYGHAIPTTVEIPWRLTNAEFNTKIKQLSDNNYELTFNKYINSQQKTVKISTHDQDIHFLNKSDLLTIIEQNK